MTKADEIRKYYRDNPLASAEEEERSSLIEWKNEIRRELVEQLLEANRRETASDQIRLNAKEINKLLNEVNR